jgi:hypothetical protein
MTTVTDAMLGDLPSPVARSLRGSGVLGRELLTGVHLRQRGEILLRGRWFPFAANEQYRLDPPAFAWRVRPRRPRVSVSRSRLSELRGGRRRPFEEILPGADVFTRDERLGQCSASRQPRRELGQMLGLQVSYSIHSRPRDSSSDRVRSQYVQWGPENISIVGTRPASSLIGSPGPRSVFDVEDRLASQEDGLEHHAERIAELLIAMYCVMT